MKKLRTWIHSLPTLTVLVPIQGVSIFAWWVAGSYFNFDVYASRIFPGYDGWCNPAKEGLGIHCWGDYYYPLFLIDEQNPFSGEFPNPYPAAALTPFLFFRLLTQFSGLPSLGLFTYLAVMAASIAYSVWFATKGVSFERRILLFSALVLLSPAVLAVLDRGNSVGFLVPILIWLFTCMRNGNQRQAVWALAIMSVIKPHFGLMTLALILAGRFRIGFKAMALGISLNIGAFLVFWARDFPDNFITWLGNFISYQEYGSVAVPWPQNVSFSQAIYSLFFGLDIIFPGALQPTLQLIEKNQGVWGPLVLLLVFALLALYGKKLTTGQILILATSAISMTSAISFYYYIVLAVPFLLILFIESRDGAELLGAGPEAFVSNAAVKLWTQAYLWVASILTLVQFPVPGLVHEDKILGSGSLIGGVWIICYLVLLFSLMREGRIRAPNSGS